MAIFVRNQRSLDSSVSTSQFTARHLVLLRELFLAGRWTQNAISNGATWDANIVLNLSDCVVSAASPGRITSVTGGFTGYEGYAITLIGGTNDYDNNRGVYRIAIVHSDNEIEVEYPPPDGWTSDTAMTGRVFNWGADSLLGGAEYVVMDPPTGNNQAYLGKPTTDYYFDFQAHPRGDYPNNPTQAWQAQLSSADRKARWNAYFSGSTAFIFWRTDGGAVWWALLFGELEDTVAEDLYPGFMTSAGGADIWNITNGDLSNLYMLYDDGGIGQVTGYVASVCRGQDTVGSRQNINTLCRTVKGKAQLVKPWVYMAGPNGGYFRGRHPFRYTNFYWEAWRPMDPAGAWLHHNESGVFPRNGVNDPRPIINAG